MNKICYACESNFPVSVIEAELSKIPEDSYLYTFHSAGNSIVKSLATSLDFRVIVINCDEQKKISGIVEILNFCNSVILFYNEIQYSNGLDLIKTICLGYKIPLRIVRSNCVSVSYNNYPRPSTKERNIDYRKINYVREENINTKYDKTASLFNLMSNYDRASAKKKSRSVIRIDAEVYIKRR